MKGKTFAIIGNEYINMYGHDNPILQPGDECYFLFNNIEDYHRPLVGRGLIVEHRIIDDMSKFYYIKLIECLEAPLIYYKFVQTATLQLHVYNDETDIVTKHGKHLHISPSFDFNKYCLQIPGFFVRKDLDKLLELRRKYILHIKNDNDKITNDIDEMLIANIK